MTGQDGQRVEVVLCAVDDSEHARRIVEVADSVAKQLRSARLVLFSAATAEIQGTSDGPIAEREEDAKLRAKTRLEEIAAQIGVDCEVLVRTDKPAEAILAVAEQTGAHLIVLGTAGRSGIRRVIMGSTAESVLRDSSVPVLVFPIK